MYTTYHLASADEVPNIVDSIMSAYKSKAITITIEEDEDELTEEMKTILDKRLMEDESEYITAEESISQMRARYGL
jgi:hypothetical protein